MKSARVVVTGLGAVSPMGLSVDNLWSGLSSGKCGISSIQSFDTSDFACQIAGEVPQYTIQNYVPRFHRKATKLMSRDIELAVIAAGQAIENSGLITKAVDPENININPERIAVNLGAGMISCDLVEIAPAIAACSINGIFNNRKWGVEGINMVTPLWLLKYLPNMLACHISIIHDIQGPSNTITCAEASAHISIGEAMQIIKRRDCDIAITGGAEAKVNPLMIMRQCVFGRINKTDKEPEISCKPFDEDAHGTVVGEAGAILILEAIEYALNRNATIYAEIMAVGQSIGPGRNYRGIEANGKCIQFAIEQALGQAEIEPVDIDLIIPHGISIPEDDLAEAYGIESALGSVVNEIPAWPTKSMLSNTGAASGALDVIAAIFCINNDIIPASRNCDNIHPKCRLNINKQKIQKSIKNVLCTSYTHGGQATALIIKKYEE